MHEQQSNVTSTFQITIEAEQLVEQTEFPALSTDKCYFQIEFHPFEHIQSFLLLPGKENRILYEMYDGHGYEKQMIAVILHHHPNAIRIYSAQMEAEQNRRHEEAKQKQLCCQHENASITLYDKHPKMYTLREGKIAESDEDFEPDPLWEVEVDCPDCHLSAAYPDWRKAPEPIHTYSQRCFDKE